MEDGTLK